MLHILHAFEAGADGVLIAGCLPGTCHYLKGNLHARQRVNHIRGLLEEIGLGSERLRMVNVSAAMGARFSELATELVETIEALGPSPLASGGKRGSAPMEEAQANHG